MTKRRDKDESEFQLLPKGNSVNSSYYSNGCILILSSSLFVIIMCLVYYHKSDHSNSHTNNAPCVTPFGTVTGQDAMKVVGYSNCNDQYTSSESNYVNEDIYSGLRWQCVEYSRRWLIEVRQVTFQSVDIAAQIWDLNTVTKVGTDETLPFLAFDNGLTQRAPEVGCLLIYDTNLAPTGHVAVVVGVDASNSTVFIGEQNWSNDYWLGPNYARNTSLLRSAAGNYSVSEEYLLGWKCVQY